MAKSLRSKWKRKMRAVKRERYAVKELKQLKSILEINKDADMSDICTVLPEGSLSKSRNVTEPTKEGTESNTGETSQSGAMEVDSGSKYHRVKLVDEHGHYPPWMNKRAIKKHKARLVKLGRVQKKGKKNKRKV